MNDSSVIVHTIGNTSRSIIAGVVTARIGARGGGGGGGGGCDGSIVGMVFLTTSIAATRVVPLPAGTITCTHAEERGTTPYT